MAATRRILRNCVTEWEGSGVVERWYRSGLAVRRERSRARSTSVSSSELAYALAISASFSKRLLRRSWVFR